MGRTNQTTVTWPSLSGKKDTRTINHVIDIRDFRGTPGYSMLVVAANTHLAVWDIWRFLDMEARDHDLPLIERAQSWIRRRRWVFQPPGTNNYKNNLADPDGKDKRACAIMAENRTFSLRDLSRLLAERGIARSREWVRKHRGDAVR